jgi:hypothetical protein
MTTKQALRELKTLAAAAADNLYRRIELAATVMSDLDWIAEIHGGSDLKAQDALESEFFRDLGGYVTLGKLIAMYRHVPHDEWKGVKYDVAGVEAIYDGRVDTEDAGEKGKRTSWKQLAEERQDKIDRLESAHKQVSDLATRQTSELDQLRARVKELETENARLLGRIEELERRAVTV